MLLYIIGELHAQHYGFTYLTTGSTCVQKVKYKDAYFSNMPRLQRVLAAKGEVVLGPALVEEFLGMLGGESMEWEESDSSTRRQRLGGSASRGMLARGQV